MIVFIKEEKVKSKKANKHTTDIYIHILTTIEVQCMSNNALNATSNSEMSFI